MSLDTFDGIVTAVIVGAILLYLMRPKDRVHSRFRT